MQLKLLSRTRFLAGAFSLVLFFFLPARAFDQSDVRSPRSAPEGEAGEGTVPKLPAEPLTISPAEQARIEAKTTALRSLAEAIAARKRDLDELEASRTETGSAEERADLLGRLKAVREEIASLRAQFDAIAGEVDLAAFEGGAQQPFDLQSEIIQLLEPLVLGIKKATEDPRAISELGNQIAHFQSLAQQAEEAVQRAESAKAGASPEVAAALDRSVESWRERQRSFERQRDIALSELRRRESSRRALFDVVQEELSNFFSSRGLHLLFGVVSFLGVFFLFRVIHRGAFLPLYQKRTRSFPLRAINVLFHVLTVVAAIAALLIAFFAVNDWPLLVIVLLFLAGVGWVSIRGIPRFFEQIRFLLNIGAVRENERLTYNGLPWRVDALMIHSRLSNPLLTGGQLRIPLRDLMGLHSRPMDPGEPWFPCREGDWVRLASGRRGQVPRQTPETVELRPPGGGLVTLPTAAFLGENPQNLSQGFRIDIVFGIDYAHQAIATAEVPKKMKERLERDLATILPAEQIRRLDVEFREAGASSLDYEVQIDLDGAAAPYYEPLQRATARILVDLCNENGWVIPFTQVTIHQGE